MRRLTLLFILVSTLFGSLSAQESHDYVPLVHDGVTWVYYMENIFTGDAAVFEYRFDGTKEVGGKTFHRLCSRKNDGEWSEISLYREERHRVYEITDMIDIEAFYLTDPNIGEYLVMDFDDMKSVFALGYYDNATFEDGTCEMADGTTRHAIYIDGTLRYIEGIGTDDGILHDLILPGDGSRFHLSYVVDGDNVVYYGQANERHRFYEKYGLSFYHCDLNRDGNINSGDVAALYGTLTGSDEQYELDESLKALYDVNGDGEVNSADVSTLYDLIVK